MQLTLEELRYLSKVLETTDSWTIARGEQLDHPSVKHSKLRQKVDDEIFKKTK